MIIILLEHGGAIFSMRAAMEILEEQHRDELATVEACVRDVRCPAHGDPSGVVHVTLAPLGVTVDEPCCDAGVRAMHEGLGLTPPT